MGIQNTTATESNMHTQM